MIASQKRISRKAKLISQVRAIRKNNPAVDEPCFEKDSEVKKTLDRFVLLLGPFLEVLWGHMQPSFNILSENSIQFTFSQ